MMSETVICEKSLIQGLRVKLWRAKKHLSEHLLSLPNRMAGDSAVSCARRDAFDRWCVSSYPP